MRLAVLDLQLRLRADGFDVIQHFHLLLRRERAGFFSNGFQGAHIIRFSFHFACDKWPCARALARRMMCSKVIKSSNSDFSSGVRPSVFSLRINDSTRALASADA